jgi:hypothetical protein
MILQTVDLSSSHIAAIELAAGREFQDKENIVECGRGAKLTSAEEHRDATDRMRYELYLLDRSQRRLSIEDLVSALLDSPGAEVSSRSMDSDA